MPTIASRASPATVAGAISENGAIFYSPGGQHQTGESQSGAGLVPFDKDVSEEEKLAQARLQARRKRYHEEAFAAGSTQNQQRARTGDLFPAVSQEDPDALAWERTGFLDPDKLQRAKSYSKFVMPSGNLTRDQLKELVVRLNLPHTKEMVQLVDLMYRHHLNTASSAPLKLPGDSPIYEGLARFWESISTKTAGEKFKPARDGPKIAASRVQALQGDHE